MNEQQQTIKQPPIAPLDLERCGFSAAEIRKLVVLRDGYDPLIEQLESRRQWEQMRFLRWLYHNGIYPRG